MRTKTFYYANELTDDFADTGIKRKPLKKGFRYEKRNPFWHALAFVFYRLIATPIAWLWQRVVLGDRIKGKSKLRPYRKTGYYLYGNHTQFAGDAFTPSLVTFPKKSYILVGPDAFSIPAVSSLVAMMGGVPIPDTVEHTRAFMKWINRAADKKRVTVIYPEAHIWPQYTGIRPFDAVSFRYPAQQGLPVFTFTRTFHKRSWGKRPHCTVYVDGPFFADEGLSVREKKQSLRDQAYFAMVKRSKESDYSVHTYLKVAKREEDESAKTGG